ncbi:DedA family protein [Jiella sp. MQZ9-1]|uniref:DedA family protein n=1 Tax=Jiella flava TaxID=2816857 RepID=A0A939FWI7_9HYPH|nr:DedA family protein [Jiella flava]MBO0661541.1 DedA family protein [Jiella flava]MCD2470183.1 DedA family protein [Jiella flava]
MTEYLAQYGTGFLFLVVLLESTGLPLPGESLVVAGGLLAGQGSLSLWLVLGAAWAGSIVGDNIGYAVGRRYGRTIVVRWGEHFGLGEKRFKMVEDRFDNYGIAVVLIARFIIILRQLNGFVAGTMKMNWPVFLLYNSISAALWSLAYGGLAYAFGSAFQTYFAGHSTWPLYVAAAAICLIGCVGTYRFLFHSKDEEQDESRGGNGEGGEGTRREA